VFQAVCCTAFGTNAHRSSFFLLIFFPQFFFSTSTGISRRRDTHSASADWIGWLMGPSMDTGIADEWMGLEYGGIH